MQEQDTKQPEKQILVDEISSKNSCPNCGNVRRHGTFTAWIFGGTTVQGCACSTGSGQSTLGGTNRRSSWRIKSESSSSMAKLFRRSPEERGLEFKDEESNNNVELVVKQDKILTSRYAIGNLIGMGGMGSVYKAEDKQLNKTFAIKILRPELAKDPLASRRFEQEAKAVSNLTHPNLVAVYDYGVSVKGSPYIVMDYLDGTGLEKLIEDHVYLDFERVVDLFIQVSDAVAYAHNKRVIHRDLKPGNIIVLSSSDGSDIAKIVDFGIAKVIPESNKTTMSVTQTGEVFGSPYYMSPEQCTGRKMDGRSDIYSLGCVMYEALSGKTPFHAINPIQTILKHVTELPEPLVLRFSNLGISSDLNYVVMRCLEKHPDDRYQTADALRDDLVAIKEKRRLKKVEPRRRQFTTPVIGQLKLQSWAYLLALTIVLMAASFLLALQSQSGQQQTAGKSFLTLEDRWKQLDVSGQEKFDRNDLQGAGKSFEQALEIAEKQPGSTRLLKASLNELIDLRRKEGKETTALTHRLRGLQDVAEKNAQVIESKLDEWLKRPKAGIEDRHVIEDLANSANDQVVSLIDSGQTASAAKLVIKATSVVKQHLGVENETMTRCIHNQAYLAHNLGNLDQALTLYRSALDLERKVFSGDHANTAMTLLMIGRINIQKGQYSYSETERLLNESLSMFRRLAGAGSTKVARVHYHLGLLYFDQGNLEEARSQVETALSLYTNANEQDPVSMARCYVLSGAISSKLEDYHQAVEILEKQTDKDYPLLVTALTEYARAIAPSFPDKAKPLLERAKAISLRFGMMDQARADWNIISQLASLATSQGEKQYSSALYQEALSSCKQGFGENSKEYFDAVVNMAVMYDDFGDRQSAATYYKQALDLLNHVSSIDSTRRQAFLNRFHHFHN